MTIHHNKLMLVTIGLLLIALGYALGVFFQPGKKPEVKPSEVKPIEFNPIVNNKNFEAALKNKTIQLLAPASGLAPEKIQQLQSLKQFNIVVPPDTFETSIIFHSNSDEKRLAFLKEALLKPAKDTVFWAFRGGYGSARLLPSLLGLPKPEQAKIFIGYSDSTALHLFLSQHWQWQTIHGAVLAELLNPNKDPENFQKIAEMISLKKGDFKIENLKPLNDLAAHTQKISGPLTGGNLTIVETSLGSDWQIQTTDKIIFLEDTDVKGYHVDRSLTHLKQAGVFNNAKAIVFGNFIEADENVTLALNRFASEVGIPVFKTDQFGHGKINYPLVYNANSDIVPDKANNDFELIMHINLP